MEKIDLIIQERRLRWLVHVLRMDDNRLCQDSCTLAQEVQRESQQEAKNWIDTIQQNLTSSCAVAKRPRDASCHRIFCSVTQVHSRSFEMTLLSRAYASPHYYSIETMSASRTVSEIFSVKEQRYLETGGRGRSRSLKMTPFDRSYTTFYWSVIVSIALYCTIF